MKLPQLSLRELFLLVVIAAMGCGWWMDQRRIDKRRAELDAHEEVLMRGADDATRKAKTMERMIRFLVKKYPNELEQTAIELNSLTD